MWSINNIFQAIEYYSQIWSPTLSRVSK